MLALDDTTNTPSRTYYESVRAVFDLLLALRTTLDARPLNLPDIYRCAFAAERGLRDLPEAIVVPSVRERIDAIRARLREPFEIFGLGVGARDGLVLMEILAALASCEDDCPHRALPYYGIARDPSLRPLPAYETLAISKAFCMHESVFNTGHLVDEPLGCSACGDVFDSDEALAIARAMVEADIESAVNGTGK